MIFDKTKTYLLTLNREGTDLTFTATEIETVGDLISFKDKFNQKLIFHLDQFRQASEVKP